jgi:predicted small lipoprotein YifL
MKKIFIIIAVLAVLFTATSCGTGLHNGKMTLPVVLKNDPSTQAGININMVPKTGTMSKISINLTDIDSLDGTSLTVTGEGLASTDAGSPISWTNDATDLTKTIEGGKVSFEFYTSDYPDWNKNEPAFKIVYTGTWDNFLEGVDGNVSITGSADKDTVLNIDMLVY